MPKKVSAYIALGSNLGKRRKNINLALELLADRSELEVKKISPLQETDPVGGPPQGKFLNGVAEIDTSLTARGLLSCLHSIENSLGRTRQERWGPRTIDLDILLYGGKIIDEDGLIIPHPRMHERLFVLEPLCRIAPHARHPGLKKEVRELLRELQD